MRRRGVKKVWLSYMISLGLFFFKLFLHAHLYICRRFYRLIGGLQEPDEANCYKKWSNRSSSDDCQKRTNDINKPGAAGWVFHALILTSSPLTTVQTVQGSACCNALMTWTVSRGQIDRNTHSQICRHWLGKMILCPNGGIMWLIQHYSKLLEE